MSSNFCKNELIRAVAVTGITPPIQALAVILGAVILYNQSSPREREVLDALIGTNGAVAGAISGAIGSFMINGFHCYSSPQSGLNNIALRVALSQFMGMPFSLVSSAYVLTQAGIEHDVGLGLFSAALGTLCVGLPVVALAHLMYTKGPDKQRLSQCASSLFAVARSAIDIRPRVKKESLGAEEKLLVASLTGPRSHYTGDSLLAPPAGSINNV